MNILILSGKFGLGHISAAEAIKEKILLDNPEYNVEVIDFIAYLLPKLHIPAYKLFNFLVNKCHSIYNIFDRIIAKNSTAPLKKVVAKKIDELLKNNKADMIISTHPLCTEYISTYKKTYHKNLVLNTFITDVEPSSEWISNEVNLYYVASNITKDILIKNNIPESRIIISGIPVKKDFKCKEKKTNPKHILIMGGGLGIIPYAKKLLAILDKASDLKTTIIVGNNKRLYKKLQNKYHNINVIGFTKNVAKYMNESSLIITKPGGITTFEALASETPLIVTKPFLLQEWGNARFIKNNDIGVVIPKKHRNIASSIIELVNDSKRLQEMSTNMHNLKKCYSKSSYIKNIPKKEELICS